MKKATYIEKISSTFEKYPVGTLFSTSEILHILYTEHGINPANTHPSDHSYNQTNIGNLAYAPVGKLLIFERIGRAKYKYLGRNYPYTGKVYRYPKGTKEEVLVGEWKNGTFYPV